MKATELKAEFFKSLGHPIRVKILEELRENGCCVCDMAKRLGENQPQISKNLIALKHSGILVSEKKGNKICYKLKNKDVIRLMEIAGRMIKKESETILQAFEKK